MFNEEENIFPLAREVREAFAFLDGWELVFVDDASTDGTWQKIMLARDMDLRVRGLRHERNAGQSAALWTGFQATHSRLIATLDGDLQNDPADLIRLLDELEGVDFVCGVRVHRKDNWLRRVSSRVARKARKWVLRVDFSDTGCAARVFKRTALAGLFPFDGLHRFLPVLMHAAGARTKEVPVAHRPRVAGYSKYGVWNRLGRGILDLLAIAWYQRRRIAEIPSHEPAPLRQAA